MDCGADWISGRASLCIRGILWLRYETSQPCYRGETREEVPFPGRGRRDCGDPDAGDAGRQLRRRAPRRRPLSLLSLPGPSPLEPLLLELSLLLRDPDLRVRPG